jgi:2-methylisocitrate lyase-like PEP mutase family enzyme
MTIERTPSARPASLAEVFHLLHVPGKPLLLANAWDAGSARLIESCGASALATTSAGLAWAHGYPDGDVLPPGVLATAVAEITRVVSVPLSVDAEGGYSDDPKAVGEVVRAIVDAGGIGINIEDGSGSPDLLVAKIAAARTAAAAAGVNIFINARADVYLRGLVPVDRELDETLRRAARYREAGCDGFFVPGVTDPEAIRTIAATVELPLNVLVSQNLPPVPALAELGVARVSAGSGIAQIAAGVVQRIVTDFLADGRFEAMLEKTVDYAQLNALHSAYARERAAERSTQLSSSRRDSRK